MFIARAVYSISVAIELVHVLFRNLCTLVKLLSLKRSNRSMYRNSTSVKEGNTTIYIYIYILMNIIQ